MASIPPTITPTKVACNEGKAISKIENQEGHVFYLTVDKIANIYFMPSTFIDMLSYQDYKNTFLYICKDCMVAILQDGPYS